MTQDISQSNDINVVWSPEAISHSQRKALLAQENFILWFTGLSGSGKSTLSRAVETQLYAKKRHTYRLDGDNMRHGLCNDLTFSANDRHENIRRIAEVSSLFVDAGLIVLAAFISPFHQEREFARSLVGGRRFIEVYCHCPLAVCEQRDPKGFYKKARAGEIKEYTGISSPYEEPTQASIVVETAEHDVANCSQQVIDYLTELNLI